MWSNAYLTLLCAEPGNLAGRAPEQLDTAVPTSQTIPAEVVELRVKHCVRKRVERQTCQRWFVAVSSRCSSNWVFLLFVVFCLFMVAFGRCCVRSRLDLGWIQLWSNHVDWQFSKVNFVVTNKCSQSLESSHNILNTSLFSQHNYDVGNDYGTSCSSFSYIYSSYTPKFRFKIAF